MRGFVGHADGQRGPVGVGVNGHARNIQLAESANKANSNLAAIGNEDLTEHKGPIVAGERAIMNV